WVSIEDQLTRLGFNRRSTDQVGFNGRLTDQPETSTATIVTTTRLITGTTRSTTSVQQPLSTMILRTTSTTSTTSRSTTTTTIPVWVLTGSMSTARFYHTQVTLTNGNVLVAGGIADASTVLSSAEVYNPSTGR
ncbi:unnamed protein product, partial [Adineta steineri]